MQAPAKESLLKVIGDRADDMRPEHATVMQRNATPIICQRKNVRMRKGAFSHCKAAIPHAGGSVETKVNCIKWLGEQVMSCTF